MIIGGAIGNVIDRLQFGAMIISSMSPIILGFQYCRLRGRGRRRDSCAWDPRKKLSSREPNQLTFTGVTPTIGSYSSPDFLEGA